MSNQIKQIKSAIKMHKHVCKQDPAYKALYDLALIANIKRIIK